MYNNMRVGEDTYCRRRLPILFELARHRHLLAVDRIITVSRVPPTCRRRRRAGVVQHGGRYVERRNVERCKGIKVFGWIGLRNVMASSGLRTLA